MEHDVDHGPEKTCFVISPIGEEHSETREHADSVFYNIIEPAAQIAGLACLRSDRISSPGMITTQVINHVLNDRIVVADLSGHNPNVYYELALRHAFRKPVIQLLAADEKLPFDVQGVRTVKYELISAEATHRAREMVQRQMASAMAPNFEVESPVTITARIEELSRSSSPPIQAMFDSILEQIVELNRNLANTGLYCRPDELRQLIPTVVKEQTVEILERFEKEIELLNSIKEAGVIGIDKRRETALKSFMRDLDEEERDIMIIGSSLKGLIQKEEYTDVTEKLRFKVTHNVRVRFLLTHPVVADFRSTQENRRPTEMGSEIINSIRLLKSWGVDPSLVRMYLGMPTCFAIKTSRRMIINPYPYLSVGYDSPCIILDRSGYLFDQFKARHFGAWDTGLAVQISDYDQTIDCCERMLDEYAHGVTALLSKGHLGANQVFAAGSGSPL